MKWAPYVLVAIISSGVTAYLFSTGHIVGPSMAQNPPKLDLSYSDFISALLTGLGLILAALAIVIGLVAFRTINEIKREAGNIAEQHSKLEVEKALETLPERVADAVEVQVKEHLPDAIDRAVEKASNEGRMDEALQKAMMQFTAGGGEMNAELQPDFETSTDEDSGNA